MEQIESHAQRIAELEEETAGGRLTVRRIDTRAAILDAFKKTFPDLSTGADFGIVKIYDEVEGLNQDYLSLPVMYSQTFIIEHNELVNARAEIQERKDIEALYGNAIDLSNKVIDKDKEIAGLKDKNTIVYKEGYEAGYARTVELRDDLESCYKEPRFKMPGVGTLALCAAGVGGGIYLGTQF